MAISYSSDDFVFLGEPGATGMGFVKVDKYVPPTWPATLLSPPKGTA